MFESEAYHIGDPVNGEVIVVWEFFREDRLRAVIVTNTTPFDFCIRASIDGTTDFIEQTIPSGTVRLRRRIRPNQDIQLTWDPQNEQWEGVSLSGCS
jgi:hypothetical protein